MYWTFPGLSYLPFFVFLLLSLLPPPSPLLPPLLLSPPLFLTFLILPSPFQTLYIFLISPLCLLPLLGPPPLSSFFSFSFLSIILGPLLPSMPSPFTSFLHSCPPQSCINLGRVRLHSTDAVHTNQVTCTPLDTWQLCLTYLTFLFMLAFPVYVDISCLCWHFPFVLTFPLCVDREFSGGWRMRLALAKALFAK